MLPALLPALLPAAAAQVEVSVMTQTVAVSHDPSLAPPAALVAALNGAMLEASLSPPRKQAKVGWREPRPRRTRCLCLLRCRPARPMGPRVCDALDG